MAGDRWIFTREQIAQSPSRKCGMDAEKELNYRQQTANMVQDMGQRLQVTQLCINTAIVYMHRFYMYHSFTKFTRTSMALACLFLAAKVEEQPRKLEHVIKVAHVCFHRYENHTPLDTKSDQYLEQAQELVVNENILLQTLGFEITVDHPHSHIVKTCGMIRASKDMAQTSYFLATNSLHLTTMAMEFKPTIVACVCINLACKWASFMIPKSSEGREWWYYVDKSLTKERLDSLTAYFLGVLDKAPSKLKKKLMSTKEEMANSAAKAAAAAAVATSAQQPQTAAHPAATAATSAAASDKKPIIPPHQHRHVSAPSASLSSAKQAEAAASRQPQSSSSSSSQPPVARPKPPPPPPPSEPVMRRVKTESFLGGINPKEDQIQKERERVERDRHRFLQKEKDRNLFEQMKRKEELKKAEDSKRPRKVSVSKSPVKQRKPSTDPKQLQDEAQRDELKVMLTRLPEGEKDLQNRLSPPVEISNKPPKMDAMPSGPSDPPMKLVLSKDKSGHYSTSSEQHHKHKKHKKHKHESRKRPHSPTEHKHHKNRKHHHHSNNGLPGNSNDIAPVGNTAELMRNLDMLIQTRREAVDSAQRKQGGPPPLPAVAPPSRPPLPPSRPPLPPGDK